MSRMLHRIVVLISICSVVNPKPRGVSSRSKFSQNRSDKTLKEAIASDPHLELCNRCCSPGSYQHGNEKCGLAVDAHAFAFKLLKNLAGNSNENIVISPFSVMNIMMLLSLGTSGETQAQIRRVLNFPLYFPPEHDHIMMKCALMKYDGVSLRASNAVFYDTDKAQTRHSFVERAAHYYNVSVMGVSFTADPFHAWLTIADFIRQSSNGFLDHVLQESSISELVFVNTVYFNGTWNFEVPRNSRNQITFYRNFKTAETVKAFSVTDVFNTGVIDDFQWFGDKIRVVELPYSDQQFSMFIFKSEKGRLSLNFIEEVINTWTIGIIKSYKMEMDMVNLTIPKFSIAYQTDISGALVEMGISNLFSRNETADLTNLFYGTPDVAAERLVHSAKIMVTEAGTEAAAASIAMISRGGQRAETVTFSHPFVFVIYDSCNNLILFQGRCADPNH